MVERSVRANFFILKMKNERSGSQPILSTNETKHFLNNNLTISFFSYIVFPKVKKIFKQSLSVVIK